MVLVLRGESGTGAPGGRASLGKGGEGRACVWGGVPQAEGTAAAQAPRQDCASCVRGPWGAGDAGTGALEPGVWVGPQPSAGERSIAGRSVARGRSRCGLERGW